MKILLLNPNTSDVLTDQLAEVARKYAAAGTEIVPATGTFGVPYIANRAEAVIGANAALEILAQQHRNVDGAILAAFGDPGLGAARELFDIPIVGLAEAGMLTACMVGKKFAIVTFSTALGAWYRECVEWNQLQDRCCAIRMLDQSFKSIGSVRDEKEALLAELANRAVEEDGADVIVLAGAPLSGLADRIRDRVPVPMIDCCAAAIKQIEGLVTMQLKAPEVGTFRRPGAKDTRGLNDLLAARIEHRD
ncbi:aspartate/glutamate racemase family protein [Marinobacterium aestuariivivens]|uniref:Aspartate/glutamate racemase family protein n=1 Tax=Marinobacterium aestuariivivens TaxID=1698799 RepID=A0ABW2A2D3_9GAMM